MDSAKQIYNECKYRTKCKGCPYSEEFANNMFACKYIHDTTRPIDQLTYEEFKKIYVRIKLKNL